MSTQKLPVLSATRKATAALTKYQYITAAGAVAAAGAAGIGLVVTDADSGDDITVDILGTSTAIAGAAVADGARLQVGTGGKLITATTGVPVAQALEAGTTDQPFEVLLLPGLSAPA
jgi:hypothetical protein